MRWWRDACFDLPNQFVQLLYIGQLRHAAMLKGLVAVAGKRNTQSAKPIITCEIQMVQGGQTLRVDEEANHAFAPAVRASIIHRTHRAVGKLRQKLDIAQRQVFTQGHAVLQPMRAVAQRHASHLLLRFAHRSQSAHPLRLSGVGQPPQVQDVGQGSGSHANALRFWPRCRAKAMS